MHLSILEAQNQPILMKDNYLLLLANINNIIDHFTFLNFKKKFITYNLCTPEGKKRLRCSEQKRASFHVPLS